MIIITGKEKKYLVLPKIVKTTRSSLWVVDENGKESKYQRISSPPKPIIKRNLAVLRKKPKNNTMSKVYRIAAKMGQCRVMLKNLSPAEIEAEKAKLKRDAI